MTGPSKPKPLIVSDFDRRFWGGIAERRLLVARCPDTGVYSFPARASGPRQYGMPELVEASGRGTVYSFVVYHRAYHPAWAADLPYVVAWIMLDEGVIMLAQLTGVAPDRVRIGMPVAVVYEAVGEQIIPRFTPVMAAV